jgi:SAM-dependent methyltransferase
VASITIAFRTCYMNDHLISSQDYWDQHAASDPLWAVLAFPDKRGGRWRLQEFMKTGEREIALLFHRFAELQLQVPSGQALDFGCGVGRLTQALARRLEHVIGFDISPVMIDLARRLNRYPDGARYICTADIGLDELPAQSFGCIYSNIVLQHVAPEISVRYLGELFRLLQPGGLLVFQLPSHHESHVNAEITPMPDAAYRAAIELTTAAPASVAASAEFALTLKVQNTSDHAWQQPQVGPMALGNHWLDAGGELMVLQDDGRSPLLQVVPPGLEWPVLLTMRAPAEPGRYVVEIDLVHEGISWFAHKGSNSLRFTVDVTRTPGPLEGSGTTLMKEYQVPPYPDDVLPRPQASGDASSAEADFPMHGVPREQVMDIIRQHGARLAYLEEDRRAGLELVSYRYFVVARSS